jgi:hypothetical protein
MMLTGCARDYVTLRYRLRVVVEIDGREYEGASVIETTLADWEGAMWFRAPEAGTISSDSWGEAVVVDLKEHGFLFGLLLPPDGIRGFNGVQPQHALSRCLESAKRFNRETFLKDIQALRGECELSDADRPALIRFGDIRNPSSAELVEPERFAEAYGPNVAFVRATISVTNDPVTEPTVDHVLPWLGEFKGRLSHKSLRDLAPLISQRAISERMTPASFKLEGV